MEVNENNIINWIEFIIKIDPIPLLSDSLKEILEDNKKNKIRNIFKGT